MIELKDLKQNKEYLNSVKELYQTAFPKAERMPFFLLYKKSQCSSVSFFAVTDDNEFCGLVYTVWYKDIVFVFYLAVSDNCRGRGLGSQILTLIKEKYSNSRLVLNIEQIDENAPNVAERKRRKEFYTKNGFFDAGYTVKEYSVVYENLCFAPKDNPITKEEYENLMKSYLGKTMFNFYKFVSK